MKREMMESHSAERLKQLRKKMLFYYRKYRDGVLSEEEYLVYIKKIDTQIDTIEVFFLKNIVCS